MAKPSLFARMLFWLYGRARCRLGLHRWRVERLHMGRIVIDEKTCEWCGYCPTWKVRAEWH
jgi:hypothetical protein